LNTLADSTLDVPARIAKEIQFLVNRGTLSPGVHLGQAELAERFSTSRVPVREALKLLATTGIVTHDPKRGFFVSPLSSAEARQLYRLRHLLEVELLQTVEWPDTAWLDTMKAKVDELEQLVKTDPQLWLGKQREFHLEIFRLSPHDLIRREVVRLWALTDRYRSLLMAATPSPKPTGFDGHEERQLIEALAAHDRETLISLYHNERSAVEALLLGVLAERGL